MGPFLLYVSLDEGYMTTIGERCPSGGTRMHTTAGPVDPDNVVACIGPLPDPWTILGRLRN